MGAKSKSTGRKAAAQAARRGRYAPEGGGTLRKGRKKLDDMDKAARLGRRKLAASILAAFGLVLVMALGAILFAPR